MGSINKIISVTSLSMHSHLNLMFQELSLIISRNLVTCAFICCVREFISVSTLAVMPAEVFSKKKVNGREFLLSEQL